MGRNRRLSSLLPLLPVLGFGLLCAAWAFANLASGSRPRTWTIVVGVLACMALVVLVSVLVFFFFARAGGVQRARNLRVSRPDALVFEAGMNAEFRRWLREHPVPTLTERHAFMSVAVVASPRSIEFWAGKAAEPVKIAGLPWSQVSKVSVARTVNGSGGVRLDLDSLQLPIEFTVLSEELSVRPRRTGRKLSEVALVLEQLRESEQETRHRFP